VSEPRAFVFDLFGTLLDYASLRAVAAEYTREPERFMEVWRAKQIALSQAGTLMGRYRPFEEITLGALRFAAAHCGARVSEAAGRRLADAWLRLPAYPDVAPALERLRASGRPLAVLTNGSEAMLRAATTHAGIADAFDHLLSVEAVEHYKPAPQVYALAVERLRLSKESIGFVSSNGWDAAGASEYGFDVYWCNRAAAPPEPLWKPPAHAIASLAELP
jgi:2-haloacid dehalogenase